MTSDDAARELHAALHACGLADRSDLGRIRATGRDVLDLLHRLSTADLRELPAGQGRPTVLTTGKGRIVARLFVHRLEEALVQLVTGPGEGATVRAHIDRFTFAEDTGLTDVTAETFQLALVGPHAASALSAAGIAVPPPYGSARGTIAGRDVWVLGEDGWSSAGLAVVGGAQDAGAVRSALLEAIGVAGGLPIGAHALEAWRVLRGHPAAGHELSGERNPLEAGLLDAISFTKGCYVGQEVVARLRTYDRVSRALVGLVFPADAPIGLAARALFLEGREVGELTSVVIPPGSESAVALAFVKRPASGPGTLLRAGGVDAGAIGRIVALPFDPIP